MKRFYICAILALALISMAALAAEKKNAPMGRELVGQVTTQANAPVNGATVFLKNTKTLVVKSYITSADGNYRFPALATNADYQVYAEYKGKRSDTRTLSSFDSRATATLNLRMPE